MPVARSINVAPRKVADGTGRVKCYAWWCSKNFNRAADMRKHADHKHLGFFYKCLFCGHKGAQKDAVETHVSNVHTRVLTSLCSCGQGFTDPSTLSKHRNETGHPRKSKLKRVPSGAISHGREPGTHDLTYELIMDTSYTPAFFTEDEFSFVSPPLKKSYTQSAPEKQTESLPIPFPTSMSSLFNSDIIQPLVLGPQLYEPSAQEPRFVWQLPHNPPHRVLVPYEWTPRSFPLGTADTSTYVPASQTLPRKEIARASEVNLQPNSGHNCAGLEPESDPGAQINSITEVQDALVKQTTAWNQDWDIVVDKLPPIVPIQQSTQPCLVDDTNTSL